MSTTRDDDSANSEENSLDCLDDKENSLENNEKKSNSPPHKNHTINLQKEYGGDHAVICHDDMP